MKKIVTLDDQMDELENVLKHSYEESPTLDEAEKLAAKFLAAQVGIARELQNVELDSRMKKSGLKSIKAAVYLKNAQSADKKPSDVMLNAMVDTDQVVGEQQDLFDNAEVRKNLLENYLSICKEGHVYFRGIAKGRFE